MKKTIRARCIGQTNQKTLHMLMMNCTPVFFSDVWLFKCFSLPPQRCLVTFGAEQTFLRTPGVKCAQNGFWSKDIRKSEIFHFFRFSWILAQIWTSARWNGALMAVVAGELSWNQLLWTRLVIFSNLKAFERRITSHSGRKKRMIWSNFASFRLFQYSLILKSLIMHLIGAVKKRVSECPCTTKL